MTGEDIVSAARAYIGVPFRHQGRSSSGLDCAGMIIRVAQSIGADYVDQSGYSRSPSKGLLKASLDRQPCLIQVLDNSLRTGDVLLMRFAREPQHLAIYAGQTIIHSYLQAGRVCEHDYAPIWANRTVCTYRFRGCE